MAPMSIWLCWICTYGRVATVRYWMHTQKKKENKYNEQKYKKSYTNNGIYMRNNMKSLSISVTLEIYVAEAFDKCTPVTVYDIAQLKEWVWNEKKKYSISRQKQRRNIDHNIDILITKRTRVRMSRAEELWMWWLSERQGIYGGKKNWQREQQQQQHQQKNKKWWTFLRCVMTAI